MLKNIKIFANYGGFQNNMLKFHSEKALIILDFVSDWMDINYNCSDLLF